VLPNFTYVRPATVAEAGQALAAKGARALSGGTDLVGCLRDHVLSADTVVSLTALDGLKSVTETADGGLRIGALATIAEIAAHDLVRSRYTALAEAAGSVASPQLRNQGTIGGNLCQKPRCWYYRSDFTCLRKGGDTCYALAGENQYHCIFGGGPCFYVHPSDPAPALVALGASVGIAGPAGARRVELERFYVPPSDDVLRETVVGLGELVTDVLLPPPAAGLRSTYRKVRPRQTWDFALVGAAVTLRLSGGRVAEARIVLSGVAPIPWRAQRAEAALAGRRLDARTIAAAAAAAADGAEPLEQNAYKVPMVRGLVEERLQALAEA
jgi:xanthine dehydrogenase YagS FAD-binding subunit